MVKLLVETHLPYSKDFVYSGFNEELFKALRPPLLTLKVEKFDGSRPGNEVHLGLGVFGLTFQKWVSLITDEKVGHDESFFVDEGKVLPFPFSKWHHTHRVQRVDDNNCKIVDDIKFQTFLGPLSFLFYPPMYLMFALRPKAYRAFFKKMKDCPEL